MIQRRLTRRAILSLLGSKAVMFGESSLQGSVPKSANSKQLPRVGEFFRYQDEVTETSVVRLTSLDTSAYLPARENRSISVKGRFLVFSSDREGALAPFRLDLRSGQVVALSASERLNRQSLALDAGGRILFLLDGKILKQVSLANHKGQTLGQDVSWFSVDSSLQDLLLVRGGKIVRPDGLGAPLAEGAKWCQVRPGGSGGCLFRRSEGAGELWFAAPGSSSQPIQVAEGPVTQPCWSPDGRSALFLREGALSEVMLDSRTERQIGGVSRFVAFSPNADGSVFVGAVRSKAQPTINLLLRNPAREFTLCEHKASDPANCAPVFSADSRRVYFNSDFQGKPAIYSVNVEALIEETSN